MNTLNSHSTSDDLHDEIARAFGAIIISRLHGERYWRTAWHVSPDEFNSLQSAGEALEVLRTGLESMKLGSVSPTSWLMTIPAADSSGFTIEVMKRREIIRIWFADMEVELDTVEDAMIWTARALSRDYQLRTVIVSGKPRQWYLERRDGRGTSNEVLACGQAILFKFLRNKKVVIRSNSFELGEEMPR